MTTNNAIAINRGSSLHQRLLDREKAILAEAERMQDVIATSSEHIYRPQVNYRTVVGNAKKRIEALRAGLLPARIIGKWFSISQLLEIGVPVPTEIAAQVDVAKKRLPGGHARVYGLENAKDPTTGRSVAAEIRRRDPVVTYRYGENDFFLGFWLEVDTDMDTPEFFGFTTSWAPKRGRGRPPKSLAW